MALFDPDRGEDAWVTFDCVACGLSVHTIQPNPEGRCLVCQFISECPPEHQDELRRRYVHGDWTCAGTPDPREASDG